MVDTKELSVLEAQFSLAPRNLTEAMEFAKLIAGTSLVPKSYRDKEGKVNPGDILIAVAMGNEVGLKPLQAIQNIAVINGQPTIWGDGMKGLVEASGLMEYCKETWDAKTQTATCTVKRKGKPEFTATFSMADATRAGLAAKETYQKYPQRMCPARARSWAFRGEFSDVLKGLQCREEVEDYEVTGTTDEGVTLMRPRRKSEAAQAPSTATPGAETASAVDAFTKEAGASKVGAPAPIDRSRLRRVLIKSAQEKQGNGKTFYVIHVEGSSGGVVETSTFSSTDFAEAKALEGEFALIDTKETRRGEKVYVNLTHIEPAEDAAPPAAEQDEPGSNG